MLYLVQDTLAGCSASDRPRLRLGVHCRSMGVLERVPLSVVLRHTGSNLSSQARVSGDATPSSSRDYEDANLFTPRWPTLHRSVPILPNSTPSSSNCISHFLYAYIRILHPMVVSPCSLLREAVLLGVAIIPDSLWIHRVNNVCDG